MGIDFSIAQPFLQKFPFLKEIDVQEVLRKGMIKTYAPSQVLFGEGDQSKYFGFVLSGLLRIYFIRDGLDYTFEFIDRNDVCGNLEMILAAKPSKRYIEAVEPSDVLVIDYGHMEKMFASNPRLDHARIKVLEENFYDMVLQVEKYIVYSPEERYQLLLDQRPDLLRRVPQKHLATYLGVTPVSLSRIKRRIT